MKLCFCVWNQRGLSPETRALSCLKTKCDWQPISSAGSEAVSQVLHNMSNHMRKHSSKSEGASWEPLSISPYTSILKASLSLPEWQFLMESHPTALHACWLYLHRPPSECKRIWSVSAGEEWGSSKTGLCAFVMPFKHDFVSLLVIMIFMVDNRVILSSSVAGFLQFLQRLHEFSTPF